MDADRRHKTSGLETEKLYYSWQIRRRELHNSICPSLLRSSLKEWHTGAQVEVVQRFASRLRTRSLGIIWIFWNGLQVHLPTFALVGDIILLYSKGNKPALGSIRGYNLYFLRLFHCINILEKLVWGKSCWCVWSHNREKHESLWRIVPQHLFQHLGVTFYFGTIENLQRSSKNSARNSLTPLLPLFLFSLFLPFLSFFPPFLSLLYVFNFQSHLRISWKCPMMEVGPSVDDIHRITWGHLGGVVS